MFIIRYVRRLFSMKLELTTSLNKNNNNLFVYSIVLLEKNPYFYFFFVLFDHSSAFDLDPDDV